MHERPDRPGELQVVEQSSQAQGPLQADRLASGSDGPGTRRSRWWRSALAFVVLGALIWAGRDYFGELHRLRQASPALIAAMIAAMLASRGFRALALQGLLARLEHRIRLADIFALSLLVSYANMLVPKLGLSAPAIYLRRRHQLGLGHFAILAVAATVLHTIAVGGVGLALVMTLNDGSHRNVNVSLSVMFAGIVAGGVVLAAMRPRVPARWSGPLFDLARRAAKVWNLLGAHPGVSAAVCLLSVGVVGLQALKLYAAFRAIDADVALAGVLMATVLSELAVLISVTPSALGFREAAVAASAAWLGCPPETALAAAVLDRLVMTACIVLLAQGAVWWLSSSGAGRSAAPARPESADR